MLYDSAAPNVNPGAIRPGTCMTDVWVYESSPRRFPASATTGVCRSISSRRTTAGTCASCSRRRNPRVTTAKDKNAVPLHEPRQRPGGTWDRGGANVYSSPVHKSETVDYGILLEGERVLVLDRGEHVMKPGDVVVQLGNWHGWQNPREGSLMAFVMMGATYSSDE